MIVWSETSSSLHQYLPVLPIKCPLRTVAIQAPRCISGWKYNEWVRGWKVHRVVLCYKQTQHGVPVTKDVVTHDCEKSCGIGPVQWLQLNPWPAKLLSAEDSLMKSEIFTWTVDDWWTLQGCRAWSPKVFGFHSPRRTTAAHRIPEGCPGLNFKFNRSWGTCIERAPWAQEWQAGRVYPVHRVAREGSCC